MPAKLLGISGYVGIDIANVARTWITDANGAQRSVGNRSQAMQICASGINNLLAWHPRPHFSKCYTMTGASTDSKDPLLLWLTPDTVRNGRQVSATIIAVPRDVATGGNPAYAARYLNGAVNCPGSIVNVVAINRYYDVYETSYQYNRGTLANTEITEGVSTFNNLRIMSFNIRDLPLSSLDTNIDTYVDLPMVTFGEPIMADAAETLRRELHQIRSENLPIVFSWSASGLTDVGSPPGDDTCITITSDTYVNVFDQAFVLVSAAAPGQNVDVQYAGIGNETLPGGKNVKVQCRVYAKAVTANAQVKFIGPDHVASNETEITITGGAGNAWWGTSSNYIYLDSSTAGDDIADNGQNRIIVHGKAPGTAELYIHGLRGWVEYP